MFFLYKEGEKELKISKEFPTVLIVSAVTILSVMSFIIWGAEKTGMAVDGSTYSCVRCPDVNIDGVINGTDTFLVTAHYGISSTDSSYDSWFDLNNDGIINDSDWPCVVDYGGVNPNTISACTNVVGDCVQCPDLDNNGIVTSQDQDILTAKYGTLWTDSGYDYRLDLNSDTIIDDKDWGCIEPYYAAYLSDLPQCSFNPDTCFQCPDVTGDGVVNIQDLTTISAKDWITSGENGYSQSLDLNYD